MSNKPKIYDITATGSTTPRDIRDRFSDVINVKDFGAVGDGITDDTEAINSAIRSLRGLGKKLHFPAGIYLVSSPVIVYKNTLLVGDSMYTTTIKLADNSNCNVVETYDWINFNKNGGNNSVQHPTLPVDFSISNLTIDGNRNKNYTNGVSHDSNNGYGFVCYGRSYYINNLFIKNCAGCGARFILRNAEGDNKISDSDFNKTRITNIFIRNTSYEGFIFEGGADVFIDNILVGEIHHPQATKNESALGMSLVFPGESIDGIVFDSYDPEGDTPKSQGTAEVGFIHSYSCYQGYCVRISGATTRLTAENIHAEGGIGNLFISAGAIGSIDKIQTRNNQYGDTRIFNRPHIDIQTSSGMDIGTVYIRKQSTEDNMSKDCLHVNGNNISIDTVKIFAFNHAGHGVVVNNALSIGLIQALNLNGSASDLTPSTALLFTSTNRTATVRQLDASNCDRAIRVVGGGWQEVLSGYIYRNSGNGFVDKNTEQIVFDTIPNINALRRWGVVVNDKGIIKYPSFVGNTENVDAASTGVQTFTVNHNMWRTPLRQEVALCVYRGAATPPHVDSFWVSNIDASSITVNALNYDGLGNAYSINIKI